MYKQLRGPERLFRFGQWAVAVLFAYFLTQVGASLIADLPSLSKSPLLEDFLDKPGIETIESSMTPVQNQIKKLEKDVDELTAKLETAREDHEKSKESFNNWRAARSSTEQSEQNPEVVARARRLDVQLKIQQEIEAKIQQITDERNQLETSIAPQYTAIETLHGEAEEQYGKALYWSSLKAFFIRLLFVAPVLAGAIQLFRRYRNSEQWPFAWGFIFFALFAFFFELVPYLPSFGGYIRYGVGALLTFLGGKALIRPLQQYLEKKSREQSAPQETRKQDIQYEKALEAISRGQCPSCERMVPGVDGAPVNFCMHCGLKIYGSCAQCGLRHNAFFLFCPSCGTQAETATHKREQDL
jgi:tetrahydromethanopterin S-methyltransferase subunit B